MIVIIAITGIPIFILKQDIYICCIIGYASHPLLDTATINGVKLFYPFSKVKCVFRWRWTIRIHTVCKQAVKRIWCFSLLLYRCIPTLFIASQGYERFIRSTQQNIEAAVRDYNEYSKDYLVFADVQRTICSRSGHWTAHLRSSELLIHRLSFSKDRIHVCIRLAKTSKQTMLLKRFYAKRKSCFCFYPQHHVSNQILVQMFSTIDTTSENILWWSIGNG